MFGLADLSESSEMILDFVRGILPLFADDNWDVIIVKLGILFFDLGMTICTEENESIAVVMSEGSRNVKGSTYGGRGTFIGFFAAARIL